MYLKKLEMQGFKSFADKTVIEFMQGITAVIGPNGSGKSNIADAIRWVLGEQSMKSLRGQKSEDVIFAGTQSRKSLGFAEVSLVFDNIDGRLPLEYTEVTVTRRLFRSGETEYLINKAPCRLKDVVELFMDTGIGKDGYSIIGQGKIDEILSNKSEDRRHVFEEASGVVKYKVRKNESEKKLEQTKLNLLRINDIIHEIEQKIEPLKEQSEKAKKYLNLKEELKNIEIGLFVYNIKELKEKIGKILIDEKIIFEQNIDEEKKLENLNILKKEVQEVIDKNTNKIEELHNLESKTVKDKEQKKSEININNEKIINNKNNSERLSNEIEELNARKNELESEVLEKKEKRNNLLQNKEKYEKELQEKENKLKEIVSKLSDKEREIEEFKKEIEQYDFIKFDKTSEIKADEANIENINKRKNIMKKELQVNILETDKFKISKEAILKLFNEIDKKRTEILNYKEKYQTKTQEGKNKILNFEVNINKLLSEMRIKESRLKFLKETEKEKEGYIKSVKSLLIECEKNKEFAKGIYGTLNNIIEVEKKYQTAIEMALGSVLQNIITETEEDAKRLVEFLRNNNIGRASFLPISSVKGNKINSINTKNIEGICEIASNVIKYDKKFEGIILNLLGKTVIVDNMEEGIKLAKQNKYGFKIVTLLGDVINSSGAISGGAVNTKTVNILGRKGEIKELEKSIIFIEEEIKKIKKEKEEYEESVKEIISESKKNEQKLQEIEIKYATENQKIISINENIYKLEEKTKKLKKESEEIVNEEQKIVKRIDENKNILKESEIKKEKLNIIIKEYAEENRDNQKNIDDLNFDVTNLKISVGSFNDSETAIEEILERIEGEISSTEINIQNKEKMINDMKIENDQLLIVNTRLNEDIKNLEKSLLKKDENVQALKDEREKKSDEIKNIEKMILEQFSKIENIKAELTKIQIKKEKTEQDIEEITNKLWEEYEYTPNNIPENYKKPENIAKASRMANKLRIEIREIGNVNVDSIEEYKEIIKRYEFMNEQRLDIESSIAKLRDVIVEMTKTMKEQFATQFKIINSNFKQTFTQLFGGGTAELILEDESNILETGIEIRVQPPGKKLQSMTLLSGGERAFTAIALLFAMLKINPSPFCVLDEIEAALDDVNVYRFAEYLKNYTKETQFLTITHRRGTMEKASTVYGITMEENGISKLLSMKLK